MGLPKSLLVPVDFGQPSLRACDRAVELARELRARVTLLHVVDPPPYPFGPRGTERVEEAAKRDLTTHAAKLRPFVSELVTAVVVGTPWRVIAAEIEAEKPDLVVLGTHGRRGFARMALGSVAERIVRTSNAPVLTVPAHAFLSREDAGRRLAVELLSHEIPASPAVIAVSRAALPVADELATKLGGTLDIWSTAPIVCAGTVVGAMGEDGLAYYDDVRCGPSIDRANAELRAKQDVEEEAAALHGARTLGEVEGRLVILVVDALTAASPILAAVRALTPLRPSAVMLAAPIAKPHGLAHVRDLVDEVVCLGTTIMADPADTYATGAAPSFRHGRTILGRSRGPATTSTSANAAPSPGSTSTRYVS